MKSIRHRFPSWLLLVLAVMAWPGSSPAEECVCDGKTAHFVERFPGYLCRDEHVPDDLCCSESSTSNLRGEGCEWVCDAGDGYCPEDHICGGVQCEPLDDCHDIGTCDEYENCTNPPKGDGASCEADNWCMLSSCRAGVCSITGPVPFECCGNGVIEADEECDDGNQVGTPGHEGLQDGCASDCTVNDLWHCSGAPSKCAIGAPTTTSTTLTTSSTAPTTTNPGGASTTTTTVTPQGACSDVTGIARARCLIAAALASDLCDGETVPTKVDRALRAQLAKAGDRLTAAATSEGRKRARMLKTAGSVLGAANRKAAAAAKSKKAARRISSDCRLRIGELVSAIEADAS